MLRKSKKGRKGMREGEKGAERKKKKEERKEGGREGEKNAATLHNVLQRIRIQRSLQKYDALKSVVFL